MNGEVDGNTLHRIYAIHFSPLYYGQLGCVVESHAYITQGCSTLTNILPSYVLSDSSPIDPLTIYDN